MQRLNDETATAIAISALQYLAGDDDLLNRFSGLTGILPNDMRSAAADPGFLVGVLDFFLAYEPDLLAWSAAEDMNPELAIAARDTLDPTDAGGFE